MLCQCFGVPHTIDHTLVKLLFEVAEENLAMTKKDLALDVLLNSDAITNKFPCFDRLVKENYPAESIDLLL